MMGPLTSMSALCACATLRLKRAYKFTGKERDSESGLDDFGARYYASTMGRFMKPDPNQTSGFEHMRDPALAEIVGVRLLAGGPGFELPTRSITVGAPSLRCWQGRV